MLKVETNVAQYNNAATRRYNVSLVRKKLRKLCFTDGGTICYDIFSFALLKWIAGENVIILSSEMVSSKAIFVF